MKNRIEIAREKHKNGYNCSQAVLCAYCDLLNIDEKMAFKLAEGFGAGMGGMRDTCGAVTAMFMLASFKNSDGMLNEGKTKKDTYNLIKKLAEEFKNDEGSIICKELLNMNNQVKKTCTDRVEAAARVVERLLLSES